MRNLESLTVRDYFIIVRRRIWYLIVAAVVVNAAAMVYIKQLKSIYKSETTIVVPGRFLPEDYIRSIDRGTANDRIDFVRQQIQSHVFLSRIVQEFQLAPATAGNNDVIVNSLRSRIEINQLSPSSFKLSFTATDPSMAQSLTRRLAEGVIQLNDSFRKDKAQVADQFLEEQSRDAANQLGQAEEKLLQFRNQKFGGAQGTISQDDLRSARAELAGLDNRLQTAINQKKSLERRLEERQQFKTVVSSPAPRNPAPIVPSGTVAPAAPPSPLEQQLARARADLAAASTRYTSQHPEVARLTLEVNQLENMVKQSQAAAASRVVRNSAPEQAVENRTPPAAFPNINPSIDLFQTEVQTEIDQVAGEIVKLEQSKKTMQARVSTMELQLNPAPALAQQMATLQREYDAARQRYNYLSDKKLNSEMAARVDASADNEIFKILDEAYLPMFPISPNRQMLAIVGFMASLICGLGAAFGREFMDSSLHTEADAAAELNLPILAGIPIVQGTLEDRFRRNLRLPVSVGFHEVTSARTFELKVADSKIRDIIVNPMAPAGEPYRLMHAKLMAMQKQQGIKSILITSAIPGEGKTFAATCLAGVLARESGRRVLLIDADLRTGSASRALGFTDSKGGLNELLDDARDLEGFTNDLATRYPDCELLPGMPSLETSVAQCSDVSMYFLPAGATLEKPSHLLNTPQLEGLIRQAERLYDWIIIDSPPVLALADANVLAPLCDGTIIVVRTGKTPSALVRGAIQRIGTERIFGLLLNRVRGKQSTYYYDSYYPKQSAAN